MAIGMRRLLTLGARTDAAELLDSGRLSRSEVEANLADLARLNRLPGGTDASVRAIERLVGTSNDADSRPRELEPATCRSPSPSVAGGSRGRRQPRRLAVADAALARARRGARRADVLALPLDDGAVDVAHCSLLIHLAPEARGDGPRGLRRVARRGVVVNDLRRGLMPLAATWVSVLALGRSRVTRADGVVGSPRLHTAGLDALLADAGLTQRWRSTGWLPRGRHRGDGMTAVTS
jgi:hypothetical protein